MLPSSYFWQGSYHLSVSSPIWLPCIHHRSTASHLNGYCVESWGPLGKWSWISCCREQSSAEQFSASTLGSRNHSGDHRNVPVDKEKHIDSHQLRKNSRKTLSQGKNWRNLTVSNRGGIPHPGLADLQEMLLRDKNSLQHRIYGDALLFILT